MAKKKEQRIKRVLLSYIEALEMEHFFGNNRGSKECFIAPDIYKKV